MTDPIKAKIQELCPDVMELKFGCEVTQNNELKDWAKQVNFISHNESNGLTYYREMDGSLFSIRGGLKNVEILGSPITLAVVLRAILKSNPKHDDERMISWEEMIVDGYGVSWNLEHDNYDQQSEECKQFIGSVLGV